MAVSAIVKRTRPAFLAWWRTYPQRWSWVVIVAIIIAAVSWSFFSIRAVHVGEAFSDDLAHAWQTTWNVAHGNGFQHSHIPLHHNESRLATHADYILILLAPLTWLWPSYSVLMVAQAIIVAIGAWFLFLLGRRWLKDEALAAVLAACYLASGMVQFPVWWQFHGVTLALTSILALVEAIAARRRWWVVLAWLILSLITKEQVGFILGPLVWLVSRHVGRKKLGWWLFGGSVVYSLVHYLWIMPHFTPTEFPHFFWKFYYGSLGVTPGEILPKLLQPRELWHRIYELYTVDAGIVLLLPMLLIPLTHPWSILALMALAPHWLSDQSSVNGVYAQNHVLAVPILWTVTIIQLGRFQGHAWWGKLRRSILLGFLGAALLSSSLRSPNFWSLTGSSQRMLVDPDLPKITELLRQVPSTAVVGYSWGLPPVSHNRKTVHVLPHGMDENTYILVHSVVSPPLKSFPETYYRPLFEYFDHDPAFQVVYRSTTIGLYSRRKNVEPGPWPKDFIDPTPSWTGRCLVECK